MVLDFVMIYWIQKKSFGRNSIEICEEPVPRTKKVSHCVVKFEASEEKRIV